MNGNRVIELAELPQLPVERFEPLDPRYLRLRWMGNGVAAVVVIVIASLVTVLAGDAIVTWVPAAIAAGILCLIALSAWLQRLEINHLGYLIRENDLSYRSGVLSRSVVTVPFARVQNVTIERGPLERWQGLASLEVKTAAGEFFGGLVISGLNHETAQRLRALVADRASALADAEDDIDSSAPVSEPSIASPPVSSPPISGPPVSGPSVAGPPPSVSGPPPPVGGPVVPPPPPEPQP